MRVARLGVVTIVIVALAGCGQSRPSQVASVIDWGPTGDCRGYINIYRGKDVTGLGYQWRRIAVDQAQIECGMDGPAVTWSKLRTAAAARAAAHDTIGAPKCLAEREIVVDLFDFGGRANRRAFAHTCARLHGVVISN